MLNHICVECGNIKNNILIQRIDGISVKLCKALSDTPECDLVLDLKRMIQLID